MAENNMQEVSKEQGATAGKEKEQDSKEDGNTGAQESEITELNLQNLLAKTFVIDDLKGEKLSGNDVRTLINQGKLLRQKQSDFDKATSEFAKKEQEWQKKIDDANNRIAQAEIDARLARLEGVNAEDYDPYAEQKPITKPAEKSPQIEEDREAFRTNLLSDVQKLLLDDRQERERNVAVNQFDADRLRIAKQQGKAEYGLTDNESEEAFKAMEVSLADMEKARQAIHNGDQDTAMKYFKEAEKYREQADKIRVDGLLRRQMSQAKEAEKKQVEIASKEIEESVSLKDYKPVMNPEKDMGQTEREILARARKNEQIMRSNRNI